MYEMDTAVYIKSKQRFVFHFNTHTTNMVLLKVWLYFMVVQLVSTEYMIFMPKVFRCDENESVLLQIFDYYNLCVRIELLDVNTEQVLKKYVKVFEENQVLFNISVEGNECLNDEVILNINGYKPLRVIEGTQLCSNMIDDSINIKQILPVKRTFGYIFIQTNLPIYRRNENVTIRVFLLNETMHINKYHVQVTLKDPSNTEVYSDIFYETSPYLRLAYFLNSSAPFGLWTVSVKYLGRNVELLKEKSSTFMVQEYIVPKFQIEINTEPKLIAEDTDVVNVTVSARYMYNKPVAGQVYMEASYGRSYFDSMQLENGQCNFNVRLMEKPANLHMFHVKVRVIESNTRVTEYKTDNTATFVSVKESDPKYKELRDANENKYFEDLLNNQENGNVSINLTLSEKEVLTVGMKVRITAKPTDKYVRMLYYMIISKGKILLLNKKPSGQNVWNFDVNIIRHMIPTAKFLVYYFQEERIISASINLNVYDICPYKIHTNKMEYLPNENIEVGISGSPGQHVVLLFMDKAMSYIDSRPKITKEFIRDEMLLNLQTDRMLNNFKLSIIGNSAKKKRDATVSKGDMLNSHAFPSTIPKESNFWAEPSPMSRSLLNGNVAEDYSTDSLSGMFYDLTLRNDGIQKINFSLPDNLTTWEIQGFGIIDNSHFCVAELVEVKTFKSFVVKMNFPKVIKQFNFTMITVLLYNYKNTALQVQVTLHESADVCSYVDGNGHHYETSVNIEANESKSIFFVIRPLNLGKFPLKVSARDTGSNYIEIIEEEMFVQANTPKSEKKENKTSTNNNLPVEKVPDNEISVKNRYLFSSIVKTALTEPGKLIRMSYGSGEQNIIYMALTIYALKYLRNTIQMDEKVYENGKEFIRMGIEKQMTFRKNDGSFSTFENTESSTWLTAYVMKIFCEALTLQEVDRSVISSAFLWLLKKQKNNGAFKEDKLIIYKEMMGIISDTGLTAFILISFMECKENFHQKILENERIILHSIEYLEQELDTIEDDLTLSIVTYALTLTRSEKSEQSWNKLNEKAISDSGKKYWIAENREKDDSLSVLTTAYSLLSRDQHDNITEAEPIFKWLMLQSNKNRIFNSTKSTVISLQALADYSIKSDIPYLNFHLDIFDELNPQEQEINNFLINRSAILEKPAISDLSEDDQNSITSLGLGSDVHLFTKNTDEEKCYFEISSRLVARNKMKNFDHPCNYSSKQRKGYANCYEISVRYLRSQNSSLTVINVGILKGYYVEEEFLKKLSANNLMHSKLNGKSTLTLIFENIPSNSTLSFHVLIFRGGKESVLYQSPIQIYELNKLHESCSILYPKKEIHLFCDPKQSQCMCTGNFLDTDCVNCSDDDELSKMEYYEQLACKANQIVAFITVLSYDSDFKTYTAKITELFKGPTSMNQNNITIIIQKAYCFCPEMDYDNDRYLIMTNRYYKSEVGYKFLIDRQGLVVKRMQRVNKINETLNKFAAKIRDVGKSFCD
ncbi:CD109 antigen-like isoform X1 [Octopus sinensis]|uniref:CD109 antigen-like isoform X1 n=1 Tax=Octopus sinensis TaxID=2607531 RepID=A0A6P7U195_9MOLL|nr:CD109 antigen-like isoform X1 [Octopus sinensis]